jgi:hypothetical protein
MFLIRRTLKVVATSFLPLDCESDENNHESNRNRPKEVTIVCIFDSLTTARLNVFPCDVRG